MKVYNNQFPYVQIKQGCGNKLSFAAFITLLMTAYLSNDLVSFPMLRWQLCEEHCSVFLSVLVKTQKLKHALIKDNNDKRMM